MRTNDLTVLLCPILTYIPGHLLFPPLFLVVSAGCGSGGVASEPTSTVRDSAGVAIVENQDGIFPDGGGWSLAVEPDLVIGDLDGPEETKLYRVRGATRLADGRFAVANDGSRELRIFLSDGSFQRSLGGEGEGPREFSSLILIGVLGDSLVALDRRLRRVSLVHPDDGFGRSFTIAEPVSSFPIGGWFFDSGSVLLYDLPLSDDEGIEDGFRRAPAPLRSCDMSGDLLIDFGVFPGAESFISTSRTDHGLVSELMSVPFGKSPQIAVAGSRLYLGSQDRFEVHVFDSDGSLLTIVRLARPPIPVTEAALESLIETELASYDDYERPAFRREFARMPGMEFQPAHGSITADRNGYLFVEEFRAPGIESVQVNVFDPEGRLEGRFEIPARVEVLEIGPDYLLALYEDAMEVEYVHLYDLTRPE